MDAGVAGLDLLLGRAAAERLSGLTGLRRAQLGTQIRRAARRAETQGLRFALGSTEWDVAAGQVRDGVFLVYAVLPSSRALELLVGRELFGDLMRRRVTSAEHGRRAAPAVLPVGG